MPLFQYEALSETGKKIGGVVDADSLFTAKEKLRKDQILVTGVVQLKEKRREAVLTSQVLLDFTRALGQLLRAGLPLYESLVTIEEKYRRHRVHPLFLDLCDQLKGGASFSDALARYPKSFDPVYLSMVRAAEQTGSLPFIFEQLSGLIGRQQKLRKQLISSLIYPAFLLSFCFVVVCTLLLFVIPSMKALFSGRQLHPMTATVLAVSDFFVENGLAVLICLISLAAGAFLWLRRAEGKRFFQTLLLKLPLFKTLVSQAALIRFSRSFAILLAGGVPIVDALRLSRKVTNNFLFEEMLERAEKKIVEGRPLSEEFQNSPLIPPLMNRMLAISEETGKVAPMLQNIAEIFEDELERSLQQLSAILQPALLMLLGLIIGVVLLSVLIPLTDVNSLM